MLVSFGVCLLVVVCWFAFGVCVCVCVLVVCLLFDFGVFVGCWFVCGLCVACWFVFGLCVGCLFVCFLVVFWLVGWLLLLVCGGVFVDLLLVCLFCC